MIPLLYLLYYLFVKAIGKVVPVFGTRLSRRVHQRAADEVARDVELEGIETVRDEQPPPEFGSSFGFGARRARTPKVTYAFSDRNVTIDGREPGGRSG